MLPTILRSIDFQTSCVTNARLQRGYSVQLCYKIVNVYSGVYHFYVGNML